MWNLHIGYIFPWKSCEIYMFHCTLSKYICFLACSVVDPNTLVLYPDPNSGFWPNLDPDLVFYYQFWKKKFKKILAKKMSFKKGYFFNNYMNKMSPKEIFAQLSLWIVILYPKPYTLLPPFYPTFTCVQLCIHGSGSRSILNMDHVRIRIYNTACMLCEFNILHWMLCEINMFPCMLCEIYIFSCMLW